MSSIGISGYRAFLGWLMPPVSLPSSDLVRGLSGQSIIPGRCLLDRPESRRWRHRAVNQSRNPPRNRTMKLADDGFLEIGSSRLEYKMIGPRPDEAATFVLLHEGLGSVGLWGDF